MTNDHMNPDINDKMIFEIGANHMGSYDKLMHMTREIAKQDLGPVRVKIQYFDPDTLVTPSSRFADGRRQKAVLWDAALAWEAVDSWITEARVLGLRPGVTVFNAADAVKLLNYPVDFLKVASPDAVDSALVETYLKDPSQRDLFISTGGLAEDEVGHLICLCSDAATRGCAGRQQVTFMHCMSQYPAPEFGFHFWQLLTEMVYGSNSNFHVGYSDHHQSEDFCKTALQLGADAVERHVYDQDSDIDVNCATAIDDLQRMMRGLANCETTTRPDEKSVRHTRRYWVATRDILQGEHLSSANCALMRCVEFDDNKVDAYIHGGMQTADSLRHLKTTAVIHKWTPISRVKVGP